MNSMPFRQLKSFFKILIGVQYDTVSESQKTKLMSRRVCLNLWLFRSAPPVMSVKQVAENPQIPAAVTHPVKGSERIAAVRKSLRLDTGKCPSRSG